MAFISSLPLLRPPIRLSTTCPRPIRAPLHTAHKPMLCTHKEDPTEATYLLPTETDAQNGTSLQDVPPSTQPPPTPGIVQSTSDLDPRVLFGEFLSTFLFVYLSINATTNPSTLANALNNGAIIAAVAASFMPVSGAHLNPAVTLALLVTNRTSIKRAAVFIPLQLLAAVAAVSLAKVLGVSIVWNGVTGGRIDFVRAFVNELLPMFIIVVVVFQTAVATEREGGVGGKIAALYIGLAVLACAGTFTTGVFNPARAFGPAFVAGNFAGHWVHWVGPIVGATVAAFMCEHLFLAPASERPPNSWLCLLQKKSTDMASRMKTLGLAGLIAYGIMNTIYYGTVFSFMLFKVGIDSGAGGLAQAWIVTWSLSQVTKPLRFALSLAMAPFIDKLLILRRNKREV